MTDHTINLQPGDTLTVTTAGAAPPPVDPPPVDPPPPDPVPPPVGDMEVIIYTHADGINQEYTFAPGTTYAIEMLMPPGPYQSQPYVYGGIAQVPSGAVSMLGKLSAAAGDLAGAPQNPNPSFTKDAQPGQRWYFNVSLLPGWATNERVRFSAFFPR